MSARPAPAGGPLASGLAIPFNRAARAGAEQEHIDAALEAGHLAADGRFTGECVEILERRLGSPALLVHSCTAALEISALLAGIGPGDEVVMPSYTFVSTANAFALRGAVPVFVDIREDTLNLDADAVAAAITPRTKAIVPVHYAGVACEMDRLVEIAAERSLTVIEDAAQGMHAYYGERPLGTIGALGTFSFHETKNITCGEGGALIVNDPKLLERAEIVREKGTDRSRFFRGQTDKYTWVDLGSSHALSELSAAFLKAQLDAVDELTERRLRIWERYRAGFADLVVAGLVRGPVVPETCTHNAHMYYLLLESRERREALIAHLAERGIGAVFHYVPLHSSPAGRRYGRAHGDLAVTDELSARLVRLPLWAEMSEPQVEAVVGAVREFFEQAG